MWTHTTTMDSSSESEDEVFFGPITEKEMLIRNQRGLIHKADRSVENYSSDSERDEENENGDINKSICFSSGEQNICCNTDSFVATISHDMKQADAGQTSGEEIYDTSNQELNVSDQNISSKMFCEEGNKQLTSYNNYSQLETVNEHDKGHINDEFLSASITDAIHDGENEYGDLDNTLRSIEDLEKSFTQVTLDGFESNGHATADQKETRVDPYGTDYFTPVTTITESKNECGNISDEVKSTELLNKTNDVIGNGLGSLVKVIEKSNSVNYLQDVNRLEKNEFDSNITDLSKINVETVTSDSTLSFKTCNTSSDSSIVNIKTSESGFSEVQSSTSSNTQCSLVSESEQEISSETDRNTVIKQFSDSKNTSEILFENLSVNNSESVTDFQMCFDYTEFSNKPEQISLHTSKLSGSLSTDLNNTCVTAVFEKNVDMCDLKSHVHVEMKNDGQETSSEEIIYHSQSQPNSKDKQNGESDFINNIREYINFSEGAEEKNYNQDTATESTTEGNVSSEASQLIPLNITAKENEPASRGENTYVLKNTETSMKEDENHELALVITQQMDDKTPSEPNTCKVESFKDLLDKLKDGSILQMNVCDLNEHVTASTGNVISQSDSGLVNNECNETDLEALNEKPANTIMETCQVEDSVTNTWSSETYGISSNENLCTDNIFPGLSEESYKTACNVDSSQNEICMSSDENLLTESVYLSHGMTDVRVNKCESIYEVKDDSHHKTSFSSKENLATKGVHSSHGMTDLTKPILENIYEETSIKIENSYTDVTEKHSQEENRLDYNNISNHSEINVSVSNKTDAENYEGDFCRSHVCETEIKQAAIIGEEICKQGETECEEEPMDISYGDLSIKNTEQLKAYRLTIDLDASLLGDIITETEFKEVLDSEEASFNIARSVTKDDNKYVPDVDSAVTNNCSLQKSNRKKVLTNSASKPPKQQKPLIRTPLFVPKTETLNVQRKWALNLGSTKPSTADNKNVVTARDALSSEKVKLQKPNTAPKSGASVICRDPKSQSKPKQENTVTPTAKRKIELTKPVISPNKRNERFKQIESPIRAYINNSPSPVASKASSHGNDNKNLSENKIPKQELMKSTEKKVSHIPMLRTPRLQLKFNSIPKRKVETMENVDPNRGGNKNTPRVKYSPYSKLPRYNDKFKNLNSIPMPKPLKNTERDIGSPVQQDKADYQVHDLTKASQDKE